MQKRKKAPLLLNRNEILQGPSPRVLKVLRDFDIKKAPLYFEGYQGSSLKDALAQKFEMPSERVSVGYGAEFFLRSIFGALRPGKDSVLVTDPHYSYYSHCSKIGEITLHSVRFMDDGAEFRFDIKKAADALRTLKPKIFIVTSPNNPTGNSIAARDLEKLLIAAGRDTLVVLDEAYCGFDAHYDEKAFLRLLERYPRMVILRSFSKKYALAGMRIGFALWGNDAKKMVRFDDLYLGTSRILDEIAIAALASEPYYRNLARTISSERESFRKSVNKLNYFKAYPSQANFVFVKVLPEAIAPTKRALGALSEVIAKFVTDDGLRVSVGLPRHMRSFASVLKDVDQGLGRR